MKIFRLMSFAIALTVLFSGCASSPVNDSANQDASLEEPQLVSLIGLTGIDMADVSKFDDMAIDDQLMLFACRGLTAYKTEAMPTDSGIPNKLNPGEGKGFLRSFSLKNLQMVKSDYPETQIYIQGVLQELAESASGDKDFMSFSKFCSTYDAVQANIEKFYAPPSAVEAGCYNIGSVRATLQEKVATTWKTIRIAAKLKKIPYCGDDYVYGAEFSISRSTLDSDRTFRVIYRALNDPFNNGKQSMTSSETVLTSGQEGLAIDSGW